MKDPDPVLGCDSKLIKQLCEMADLNPKLVHTLTLETRFDSIVEVHASLWLPDGTLQAKNFRLIEDPDESIPI